MESRIGATEGREVVLISSPGWQKGGRFLHFIAGQVVENRILQHFLHKVICKRSPVIRINKNSRKSLNLRLFLYLSLLPAVKCGLRF